MRLKFSCLACHVAVLSILSSISLIPPSSSEAISYLTSHNPGDSEVDVVFGHPSRRLKLELLECKQFNNSISCSFMLTTLDKDSQVHLGVKNVRFIDFKGQEYHSSYGEIGNKQAGPNLGASYNAIQHIPISLNIQFDQVPSTVQNIAVLEFDFRYLGIARLKNIYVKQ